MNAGRRLRILHTEASLGWGGQEIRILTEARQCAARGNELRLICDGDSDIFRAAPGFGLETTAIPLKRKSVGAFGAMRRIFSASASASVSMRCFSISAGTMMFAV